MSGDRSEEAFKVVQHIRSFGLTTTKCNQCLLQFSVCLLTRFAVQGKETRLANGLFLQEYFQTMPWAAADRKMWPGAASQFGVQGIPRLVMLNAKGHVINSDALQQVRKDAAGQDFPWPENLNPK